VDVGGNIGTLTAVILKPNPKMQAILVDREDVVVGANQVLEVAGVVDRCQIVGENFFDSLPGSAIFTYSLASSLIRNEVIFFRSGKTLWQTLLN
jgi:O-methyltransferase.